VQTLYKAGRRIFKYEIRYEEQMRLERLEQFVDRAIPFMVLVIAVELVSSFIWDLSRYASVMHVIDYVIISFFVVDLCFKWRRVRNMRVFVRLYWLDILAVFPFYWGFRAYEAITGAAHGVEQGQKIVHEALLLREAQLAREIELLRGASEGEALATRLITGGQRTLRLVALESEAAHTHLDRARCHAYDDRIQKDPVHPKHLH